MNTDNTIQLYIVLDNIRSVFNVGSIFRSADAVGHCKILLCGLTSNIDNPKLTKTSLGAETSVPSEYYPHTLDAIDTLKKLNIPIYSIELNATAVHFHKIEYPSPIALVFGHERRGVDQTILDISDKIVYVPMQGIKESLNVANTATLLMYEALRGKL